ncbi:MAG: aminoglycoside 6-adenylyltransferase, partial [Clostridia bacterium]|nr:aminoglycoside 6-adenylyltransferase [Clostridia bacterium]
PKDIYQDYDITYFVTDIKPFYNNMEWIEEKFGKPIIVQLPELMSHPLLPPQNDGHFAYLMIFEDGNRIDLSIEYNPYIDDGEPAVILLDKDNRVQALKINKEFFHIKPPQEKIYADTCNEFWWCLNNVAKGIARDELPYAMEMFNHYVRDMLNQIIEWYIGIKTNFSVSSGKMGKYFKKYLPRIIYEQYSKTYSDSNFKNLWSAIFTACDLFHNLAVQIADYSGYIYNEHDERSMMLFLNKVKNNEL